MKNGFDILQMQLKKIGWNSICFTDIIRIYIKLKKYFKKMLTKKYVFDILLMQPRKMVENDLWKLSKKVKIWVT